VRGSAASRSADTSLRRRARARAPRDGVRTRRQVTASGSIHYCAAEKERARAAAIDSRNKPDLIGLINNTSGTSAAKPRHDGATTDRSRGRHSKRRRARAERRSTKRRRAKEAGRKTKKRTQQSHKRTPKKISHGRATAARRHSTATPFYMQSLPGRPQRAYVWQD